MEPAQKVESAQKVETALKVESAQEAVGVVNKNCPDLKFCIQIRSLHFHDMASFDWCIF